MFVPSDQRQHKIRNVLFPHINSEGERSVQPSRSKLGLLMYIFLFSHMLHEQYCLVTGLHRKNWRAEHTPCGCVLRTNKEPQACYTDGQNFHLPAEALRDSAGQWEVCSCPESLSLWLHPVKKHWAPKHFQAVNSWILLSRARWNIWKLIAPTLHSCLHQQPAHGAAPQYFR